MNKILRPTLLSLGIIIGASSPLLSAQEMVEVRLVDNIDENRGYCLDIAGGRGKDAPLDKGLQAHTCYDYTGSLLEDQSFDVDLMAQGLFKIPYFDVCMSTASIEKGSAITLSACEKVDTQMFSLTSAGQLTAKANPELCITVSDSEKKNGRGATPVHVMRPLSLQACSDDQKAYQTWITFSL